MTQVRSSARSIAPARYKPTPAAGCFGFTKSDIERLQSEDLAARKTVRALLPLTA